MTTTGFKIDRATHSIVIRRRIEASPERLYTAWTTPEEVTRWWDPDGESLLECAIDARVGGSFRFVNRGHPFEGTYTRLAPPTEIAFNALGAAGSVRFEPVGTGSEMTLRIRCASAGQMDQFVAMGVAQGTSGTADRLVAHVEGSRVA